MKVAGGGDGSEGVDDDDDDMMMMMMALLVMRAWWCVAWDGVGSEGSDVVKMVMVWRWCYGGLRWGGSRRRWRRVAASGHGDRVDRAMRIHFYKVLGSPEFGRKSGRRR
ncbi:hypothetical protein Tco_1278571 [Tanacetum coccineum]